tara:strand:+ start:7428 stop:8000 length:573 start_codon:yes stop_codon:yes gene_type:complete
MSNEMWENDEGKFWTVKDLAERVSLDVSDEGISRTIRQLRHWTENDVLRTVGEKKSGKGIPRLYHPEPTMEISAFLIELARYGVTVDAMKMVADELWDTDEGFMAVSTALTDVPSMLQLSWTFDPGTGKFQSASLSLFDEQELLHGAQKFEHDRYMDFTATSSILVNMTAVLERVYERHRAIQADKTDTE